MIRALTRRRDACEELLAYRVGRHWVGLRSEEINGYLKRHGGRDFSAKDFRTWNAAVIAAVALQSITSRARTKTARKRAIDAAVRGVAEMLGNTPAVARRAYIDPRVFDRYLASHTIRVDRRRDLDGSR